MREINIKRRERAADKQPYGVLLFVFALLYYLVFMLNAGFPSVWISTYTYHLVDFSVGFCTKILPGALFNLLPGENSWDKANVYENILLALFFIGLCAMLGRFISNSPEPHRKTAVMLSVLFLTGPCTVSMYVLTLGTLDVYWAFTAILFVFALRNRYLRFLLPALCFTAILINFSSVLAYNILFSLLLLYEYCTEEDKKEKRVFAILFAVCTAVSLFAFVYFLLFEKSNLTMSIEEFDAWMDKRGAGYPYYDYSLYNVNRDSFNGGTFSPVTVSIPAAPALEKLLNKLLFQLGATFYKMSNTDIPPYTMIILVALMLPLMLPVWRFFRERMRKNRGNKTAVFLYLCAIVQFPFTLLSSLLTSTDVTRWTAHAFTVSFVLFLYIAYNEKGEPLKHFTDWFAQFPLWQKAVYYTVYSLTAFGPYC